MTAAPNPISPRTPDSANSLFAPPSRAPKPPSDTRFRDSLDQRVARDEPRPRAEPEARPASDRATDDAQNTRPGAGDAERETEIRDTNPERRSGDEGESASPDSSGSGEPVTTEQASSQPAADAQHTTVIPNATLEFKPIPSVQNASNAQQHEGEQAQATQQNAAHSRQGGVDPAEDADPAPDQSKNAPTLRLAGTDADPGTDAEQTTDNAARNAAPIDRPEAPQANHSGSNDRASSAEPTVSLAGSTASQSDSSGQQSQQDSAHREPNAVKLPTLDASPNAGDRALHVEAVQTGDAKAAESTSLRGPTLSVAKVSDAEAAQNERAIASSVSRGLAAAVQQRGGSLTIRLTPATLGTVKIDLELAHGRVAVDLHASSDLAQDAISKNIALLRSSLESKGLTVDRIAVQLAPSANQSNSANSSSANDQQQGDAQQDRDASDGESRGSRDERGDERDQNHQFGRRFDEAFGLEPGDPRAQTLRLRLSAIG